MFFTRKQYQPLRRWHWVVLGALLALALVGKLMGYYWPKATLTVSGQEFKVLIADTSAHTYRGLSGRADLGGYGGMLFVFPRRASHALVMRDMNFPLDIIWLDLDPQNNGCLAGSFGRGLFTGARPPCGAIVVDLAPNLPPEAGRAEAELTIYRARAPSIMVWELPAGLAAQYNVQIGDKIKIK